jgi:hypothetical protein
MLGAAYTIPLFITMSSCMTIGVLIMGYKNYIVNQRKTINKQNINILPYNFNKYKGYGPIKMISINIPGNNDIGTCSFTENELRTLYIKKEFRSKGYGSILLKEAEKDIEKMRYTHIYLLAVPLFNEISKEELQRFYYKNGYKYISWFGGYGMYKKL